MASSDTDPVVSSLLVLAEEQEPEKVIALDPEAASFFDAQEIEPNINLRSVRLTCDCGERFHLPMSELERERVCGACGTDATLTAAQIAQVLRVAAQAREDALARWRAGERDVVIEHCGTLTVAGGELTASSIHRDAGREAVETLGLLTPEALTTLEEQLRLGTAEHPRAIATAYRKFGEQLSREEKKAAGIRANAFMSRRAFGELTQSGRANPLDAHESTLLRASFTVSRFEKISRPVPDAVAGNLAGYRYLTISPDCPFCSRMDGQVVGFDEVTVLPSPECTCPTANYIVNQHFDWLRDGD